MLDYFVSENILGQVSIQLEMTSHDWSRLKASAAWMQVEQAQKNVPYFRV